MPSFHYRVSSYQLIVIVLISLTVFNESVTAATVKPKGRSKPGSLLQTQLDDIYQRLSEEDTETVILKQRLSAMEKEVKEIEVAENHEAMEKSIKHFENVNQIWKNNFRSIRSSFGQIREKLAFTKPNINLEREGD